MEDKSVLLSVNNLDVKFHVRGRILTAIRNISLDINNDNKLDEKDKLTIIASYIPFI